MQYSNSSNAKPQQVVVSHRGEIFNVAELTKERAARLVISLLEKDEYESVRKINQYYGHHLPRSQMKKKDFSQEENQWLDENFTLLEQNAQNNAIPINLLAIGLNGKTGEVIRSKLSKENRLQQRKGSGKLSNGDYTRVRDTIIDIFKKLLNPNYKPPQRTSQYHATVIDPRRELMKKRSRMIEDDDHEEEQQMKKKIKTEHSRVYHETKMLSSYEQPSHLVSRVPRSVEPKKLATSSTSSRPVIKSERPLIKTERKPSISDHPILHSPKTRTVNSRDTKVNIARETSRSVPATVDIKSPPQHTDKPRPSTSTSRDDKQSVRPEIEQYLALKKLENDINSTSDDEIEVVELDSQGNYQPPEEQLTGLEHCAPTTTTATSNETWKQLRIGSSNDPTEYLPCLISKEILQDLIVAGIKPRIDLNKQ
jgi:hypothetical protein